MRIDCVINRSAAELRSGWAEKSIRSERKTFAQTRAVNRRIPACAMTAVPGGMSVRDDLGVEKRGIPIIKL